MRDLSGEREVLAESIASALGSGYTVEEDRSGADPSEWRILEPPESRDHKHVL